MKGSDANVRGKNAYFLLGSNLGDRNLNLAIAVTKLKEQIGNVIVKSSIYETAPWGKTDQPGFLNQAIVIRSEIPALQLLRMILAIEQQMGRVRLEKWGQRLIDIDLVFNENEVLNTESLQLPHPEMHKRKFVLVPLVEIAPDFIHPIFNQKISEILFNLNDNLSVLKK